jgi:hypothetical protein
MGSAGLNPVVPSRPVQGKSTGETPALLKSTGETPALRGARAAAQAVGAGFRKCLEKPAVRDNRGTPLTLTLAPEAAERGLFRPPLPLGEGWGEGAFPRIDAQSCYLFWCVPSFETLSSNLPFTEHRCPRRGSSRMQWMPSCSARYRWATASR